MSPQTASTVEVHYADQADRLDCPMRFVRWQRSGLTLKTKWQFTIGTELEISLQCASGFYQCRGVVVECVRSETTPGLFDTTLYSWVEAPPGLTHEQKDSLK